MDILTQKTKTNNWQKHLMSRGDQQIDHCLDTSDEENLALA